jgi:predicted histidine transporter YuiF (NhaC family)
VESAVPLALVLGGVALVVIGLLSRAGRGSAFGRMPGDLRARRGPVTFYAPLGTSLLLSVILTVVLNLAFCAGPR